jgi:hypothetical protein
MSFSLLVLTFLVLPTVVFAPHILQVNLGGETLTLQYNGTFSNYEVTTETFNLSSYRVSAVWVILYNGSPPETKEYLAANGLELNVSGNVLTVPLYEVKPNSSSLFQLNQYDVGLFVFVNTTNVHTVPSPTTEVTHGSSLNYIWIYGSLGYLFFTVLKTLRRNK